MGGALDPPLEEPPKVDPPVVVLPDDTLTVSGGMLRDHCGGPLVLRGVNELMAWTLSTEALPWIPEIAQTGANAVRVLWLSTGWPKELDAILEAIASEGMVAVFEIHEYEESVSEADALEQVVDLLTGQALLEVLIDHEKSLVIEVGTGRTSAPPEEWQENHSRALNRLRDAGLRVPISVRAPSWREDLETTISVQQALSDSDPLKNNLVNFTHWRDHQEGTEEYVLALKGAEIPAYVSEFSGYRSADCPAEATDLDAFLKLTELHQMGWFAWSWGGVKNGDCATGPLDMSLDGTLSGLFGWGRGVALSHPQGISRTSVPIRTLNLTECP
jgi:mannan endo-1,4-beta-mannosidase